MICPRYLSHEYIMVRMDIIVKKYHSASNYQSCFFLFSTNAWRKSLNLIMDGVICMSSLPILLNFLAQQKLTCTTCLCRGCAQFSLSSGTSSPRNSRRSQLEHFDTHDHWSGRSERNWSQYSIAGVRKCRTSRFSNTICLHHHQQEVALFPTFSINQQRN